MKFNNYYFNHRRYCLKKGPECQTNLPHEHKIVAQIYYNTDNSIDWHFIDGTKKKVIPFKYTPKQNIGDQFMNVNNDIDTTVLACNNNFTTGDKVCF